MNGRCYLCRRLGEWAVGDITLKAALPIRPHTATVPGALAASMLEGMEPQGRMIGLDVGDRHLGVALSDSLGMAQPLLTMGPSSDKERVRNIARLVRRHQAAGVAVGNPLHMSGDLSRQAAKVHTFVEALRAALPVPVHLQDERLSSTAAGEWMNRLGIPRGPGRKGLLDQYAAAVILQDWLDGQGRAARPAPSL